MEREEKWDGLMDWMMVDQPCTAVCSWRRGAERVSERVEVEVEVAVVERDSAVPAHPSHAIFQESVHLLIHGCMWFAGGMYVGSKNFPSVEGALRTSNSAPLYPLSKPLRQLKQPGKVCR